MRGWKLGPFTTALLMLAPVVASAALLVWTRVTTVELGYQLTRSRASLTALENRRATLERVRTSLRAPERLRTIAREELNMGPPSAETLASGAGEGPK